MKTLVDERLRLEADRFAFRFGCEHCAHFDVGQSSPSAAAANGTVGSAACANGYPSEAHRDVDLSTRSELFFCKEFELA
jgi:hypothetical protein